MGKKLNKWVLKNKLVEKMKPLKIYLCDLTYNTISVATDPFH